MPQRGPPDREGLVFCAALLFLLSDMAKAAMMREMEASDRQALRRRMLEQRDEADPARVAAANAAIGRLVLSLEELEAVEWIFAYVSFRSEVATSGLLEALLDRGHRVAVPLTLVREKRLAAVEVRDLRQDLAPGYCGIPEPRKQLVASRTLDPGRIGAALVPGSVFDESGGRMGYGGGYYDRFLARDAPQALRIGLAFSWQLVPRVPMAPHDVPMDMVITEKGVFRRRPGSRRGGSRRGTP